MTATTKDIIKVAGGCPPTVSRSLSKNLGIPKETADRLKKHLKIWDVFLAKWPGVYKQTVRKYLELLLVVMIPSTVGKLQGIEDVLQETGYSLFIAASNRDSSREQSIVQSMQDRRVDGVFLCTTPLV